MSSLHASSLLLSGRGGSQAERLDAAREAIEGRFLQAGDVLAQAVEGLGRLVRSLDQLAQTLSQDSVAATTTDLNQAAARLLALPDRHAARRETVAGLAQAGEQLGEGIEAMGRNLAYLRVFATNIKITGAGIGEARKEFADFAQEICDCIELGRSQLTAFEAELQTLRELFTQALSQEGALAEQCAAMLPMVPDSLTADAEAMASHHASIANAAQQVGALARSVQGKIGSALAALQVGDATRQRVEHVVQILGWLDEAQGLTGEASARLGAFVRGLAAAQLRAASTDFHHDIDQIGHAMQGLASDAADILKLRDLAVGREQAGGEGFLKRLEGSIVRAQALVGDMAAADEQALGMGAAAADACANLVARIAGLRTIKTDVQQMALNTTLKCARIGDAGKPLAVIAVELRVHAGHMETSAPDALAALETVSGQAGRLADRPEAAEADAADDVGSSLTAVSRRLHQASETVEADLIALADQGEIVVSALRRAAGMLDLRREIGTALDQAAEALAAAADPAPEQVTDLSAPLGLILSKAAACYTMAAERDVHAGLVAGLELDEADEAEAA